MVLKNGRQIQKKDGNTLLKKIFMVELQKESCDIIEKLFNPKGKYKLNLYNQSFLDFEYSKK